MSRYVAGGAGGFNLLRQWRKKLSTKAKEASPKASLLDSETGFRFTRALLFRIQNANDGRNHAPHFKLIIRLYLIWRVSRILGV